MSAYLLPQPQQFFDNNGDPLAGGKVYTCIPGASGYTKSYQKDSYTDATGLVANPNPVVLDSFGRCNIWGDGFNYKLFIFSPNDILIDTIDDVPCLLGSGADIVIMPSDGSVTTPKLADGAVTDIKIADSTITDTKLSTGHPTWDTGGTLSATAFSGPLTGNVTGNLSGNATTATTATKLTTASGSAPSYAARAWVSWEGSTGNIRGAGNVSSVTHTAAGLHTVNMTVAMPDTLYTVIVSCTQPALSSSCYTTGTADDTTARTASSFATRTQSGAGTDMDATYMQAAVFE